MTQKEKKENLLLNLALNIIIPTVILTRFSGEAHLGPQLGIIVALAFPIAYGVYDFIQQGKVNFFSGMGVVSVLLTGGISLLELDPKYIAIKEAAIPALLGIAVVISIKTKHPLVKVFLYNDKVMNTDKVARLLQENNNTETFEQTLINASYIVAGSFLVSAVLNYVLAKVVVVSPPGTEAFASELGKMTAYSYVVILIPSIAVMMFALYYLFKQIKKLTGLGLEEVMHDPNST